MVDDLGRAASQASPGEHLGLACRRQVRVVEPNRELQAAGDLLGIGDRSKKLFRLFTKSSYAHLVRAAGFEPAMK